MPTLRDELEALKAEIERGFASDAGWASADFLGITKEEDAYPTVAGAFYAVTPLGVTGSQAEGSGAAISPDDADLTVYVYNVGPFVPPRGTMVIVKSVPDRWVMFYA